MDSINRYFKVTIKTRDAASFQLNIVPSPWARGSSTSKPVAVQEGKTAVVTTQHSRRVMVLRQESVLFFAVWLVTLIAVLPGVHLTEPRMIIKAADSSLVEPSHLRLTTAK